MSKGSEETLVRGQSPVCQGTLFIASQSSRSGTCGSCLSRALWLSVLVTAVLITYLLASLLNLISVASRDGWTSCCEAYEQKSTVNLFLSRY